MVCFPKVKERHFCIYSSRVIKNSMNYIVGLNDWLTEWVIAGKRHWAGGRGLLHRRLESFPGKEEYVLFSLVHPSPWPPPLLLLSMEKPGAFYTWEKTIQLTWDQTVREIVTIPSSFVLLFGGSVECWEGWAEGEERRNERLGITWNSQTHYNPHVLTEC